MTIEQLESRVDQAFRSHQIAVVRDEFITKRMSDLPAAYRALLVHSDKPDALAEHEKSIRTQFAEDLKAAKPLPSVTAALDTNGMSSTQLIGIGLREAEAGKPATPPVAYCGNNPYLLIKESLKAG